ncbi:ABC transporter ATP-binding protein [Natrinema halophilum]|uniref:ABC transporter ATP-binding protein n=1 Tax=Natrinema halophilum TaxID=1699371 RepID=A0A7D5GLJ0_9EURY|nr:ABC transporter ATP-binding protein [Natrinema halophilum]QLG49950.1 ABC transporter ATP-binding protein/permease [Natrinema halophilum]
MTVARLPQRVPPLIIGVALDSLLLHSQQYSIPLIPQHVIPTSQRGQLWFTVSVIVGAIILESIFDYMGRLAYERGTLEMIHDIRTSSYESVINFQMGYFDRTSTGDIMSVMNNDINNLKKGSEAIYQAIDFGGKLVFAFAFMVVLNWELALLVAIIPIGLALVSRFYAAVLQSHYTDVRASIGTINERINDVIDGITTVKTSNREDYERTQLRDTSEEYKQNKWSAIRIRLVYDSILYFFNSIGVWGLFLVGGYWIISGPPAVFQTTLTAGTLLTFIIYSKSFLAPVRNLAVRVIDRLQDASASAERIVSLFDSPEFSEKSRNENDMEFSEPSVEYDDVTFSYDGAEEVALDDVTLTAEPGQFIGIVGSSGAGKSTLMKLLFQFYQADRGEIRIDGQDISELDLGSLRQELGYVSQDPVMFPGTVRENIIYGSPAQRRDESTIQEAAKVAGAHEFIEALPEGYDTTVGESGSQLSGGQRQRIALARVFYHDPSVLVLDEATSHVDNETEMIIQQNLQGQFDTQTIFAIAHRLSTLRNADRILVFDDGEIVERGIHEELLEMDGLYANLWRIQTGEVHFPDTMSSEYSQMANE